MFDLTAYFKRIGYQGSGLGVEQLTELVRCHLEAVPFECLDNYYERKDVSLKIEDLYEKIVTRRRGGICFELNGLLYALLKEIGYDCYPVGVRVQWLWKEVRPISHEGVLVRLDGKTYYCDVGFGGPGPKGVLCLDERSPQQVDRENFLVEKEGLEFRILRKHEGAWERVLVFSDCPWNPVDFRAICYYYATHEESRFVAHRIVNLCLPDGSLALTDDTFTERRNGEVIQTVLGLEEEISKILREKFGLIR